MHINQIKMNLIDDDIYFFYGHIQGHKGDRNYEQSIEKIPLA